MSTRPPDPKKKKAGDIQRTPLKELLLSQENRKDPVHGAELFDRGKFWHAHEAWESVWRRQAEDECLFLQGLVKAMAAYRHAAMKWSFRGVFSNLAKA
ncbi:MAG: DUF309 domain-containing protein [Bacteroidota bacterium]